MKIALGQLRICWEDKQANLERAERCAELLAERGTDMFLLPEMSLTGFSMRTDRTKEASKETVEQIKELAQKYHMAVGVGWVKDTGVLCENHYSLVTARGELLDYAKLHPFRYGGETERFRGGDALSVCEYEGFRIGVQICYDLRFPEPFQALSKAADLILVPANWPAKRREHWDTLLKARAIENMVYVAGINCAGNMGGQYYSGGSGVYAPDGACPAAEIIRLPKSCEEEQILLCEIENDVFDYRAKFPVREDRREDLYGHLKIRNTERKDTESWTKN